MGQLTGVLYLDLGVIAALGAIVWAAALGVIRLGYRSFRHESLLLQQ